ncbi:MAG: flavodoxin FldA, partial [Arsenophonus sp. NC-QC1-MAG3]
MAVIGIFFGSDTGNTENIAKMIQETLGGSDIAEIHDIAKSSKEDIEAFDILLFGIPTWYYGEAQSDWDDFFPILEEIDFTNKLVAIFGCGDQEDYAEYFCDAMGTVKEIIEHNGAIIVGHWPTEGYYFEASKGLVNDTNFI